VENVSIFYVKQVGGIVNQDLPKYKTRIIS